jgi:hypothetical protein
MRDPDENDLYAIALQDTTGEHQREESVAQLSSSEN